MPIQMPELSYKNIVGGAILGTAAIIAADLVFDQYDIAQFGIIPLAIAMPIYMMKCAYDRGLFENENTKMFVLVNTAFVVAKESFSIENYSTDIICIISAGVVSSMCGILVMDEINNLVNGAR